jgi:hypothetical protein
MQKKTSRSTGSKLPPIPPARRKPTAPEFEEPASFELGSIRELTEAKVKMLSPLTGRPTGWWVLLAGPEHPIRRERHLAAARKAREAVAETGELPESSPEQDEKDNFEDLVAYTLDWGGLVVQGVTLPCTDAEKRRVIGAPENAWARRQIHLQLQNRANFIASSSNSSLPTPGTSSGSTAD